MTQYNPNSTRYHNDGPVGTRDMDDAGGRETGQAVKINTAAFTAKDFKSQQLKIDAIVAAKVAEYAEKNGCAMPSIAINFLKIATRKEVLTGR